jgi:hypothetical protein
MVVSHLNKLIEYVEKRELEENDEDEEETDIYEMEIFKKNHYIAIGKPNYTFTTKYGVVYIPIYLLKGFSKILGKIGVFEIENNRLLSLDYKDNLGVLGEPLYLDITNAKYMEKTRSTVEKEKERELEYVKPNPLDLEEGEVVEEDEEEDIFSVKNTNKTGEKKEKTDRIVFDDVFTKDKIPPNNPSWPEETEKTFRTMKSDYEKSKSSKDNWVQSTMQNKHFAIKRNEGRGDCFFAVVRDAFLDIGYHTTVPKLRLFLSQEVNSDLFEQYHNIYTGLVNAQETNEDEMKSLATTNKRLKQQAQKGGQLKELIEGGKEIQKEYSRRKKEEADRNELLAEFGFMKHVKTLDDFRNYVQTSDFWANTWAISTLELLLNVKIIILDESTSDKYAIMKCGQLNTDITTFSPKYYIIANYTNGNHYELITYKQKGLLTFQEIPYSIKTLVVNKWAQKRVQKEAESM